MNITQTRARPGFTLVELLVVIVIIGLLAAIAVPAIMGARNAARRAAITADITQLNNKMLEYKNLHNDFPPDFTSFSVPPPSGSSDPTRTDVSRHMSGAYPRYTGRFFTDVRNFYNDPNNAWNDPGRKVDDLDPAEAIVFWLGGLSLRRGVDSTLLKPFSLNPTQPFEGSQQKQRASGLHEFDPTRLVDRDNDGWYEYIPPGPSGNTPPYVYFHFRSYTSPPADKLPEGYARYPVKGDFGWGRATPYRADPAMGPNGPGQGWVNPQSFQIICAGLDGVYGPNNPVPKYYPSGESVNNQFGYDISDLDNLTNFGTSTLEDSRP